MNLRSRYFLVPALVAVVFVLVLTGLAACAVPGQAPVLRAPAASSPAPAPSPGLPYMGYNTWYEFGLNVSEGKVLAQADIMAADGLVAEGYRYMVLDNGWQDPDRLPGGSLTWDASKFPHGIPWLAAQLQAEGITLGLYTAIGAQTCGHFPDGSYGHYAQDAATFRGWGAGFVKADDCGTLPAGTTLAQKAALFAQLGADVRGDGMIYSDELPVLDAPGSAAWLQAVAASSTAANMWRVTPDEHWPDTALFTVSSHLADDVHLHSFAAPGHWNDLDMLVPGTVDAHPFGWTLRDEQAQLGGWAMEASPLFLSTALEKLTPAGLAALRNKDVVGIDQSGAQAARVLYAGPVEAFVKPYGGGVAVFAYNTGVSGSVGFSVSLLAGWARAYYRDVWTGRAGGPVSGVSTSLGSGQGTLLVLTKA